MLSYSASMAFSLRQFSVSVNCLIAPATSNLRARRKRLSQNPVSADGTQGRGTKYAIKKKLKFAYRSNESL